MQRKTSLAGRAASLALGAFAVSTLASGTLLAQVTTGAMTGTVVSSTGASVVGASVLATHEPSGTQYGTVVREGGGYDIRGVRVGGPYTISVQMLGFATSQETEIFVNLNQTVDTDFTLVPEAIEVAGIQVEIEADPVLNSSRTGAATYVSTAQVTELPSVRRSVRDLIRLDPRNDGNYSFGGRNWLYNNLSLDGSYFNNPFGLDDPAPGGQTASEPVPYDAIEAVQVSVAPFDVRQSGFTGAAVNSVTKSGTNEWKATAYTFTRNEDFIGDKIGDVDVLVPTLEFHQTGASLGGPIVKDKAFFFVNYERVRRDDPGTNFSARLSEDEEPGGTTSRVLASDLQAISARMRDVYGYETGPFDGYFHETASDKLIFKFDWNVNESNKFTFRYNYLDARRELPPHPFAFAFGLRGPSENALPFFNSGYAINNELGSFVWELNTQHDTWGNRLFVSYNRFRDFREPNSPPFPTIEILKDGTNYTTIGHEPFSINNLLDQDVWQVTNDFSLYRGDHVYTLGTNFEAFKFGNSFNLFYYNFFPIDQYPSIEAFMDATDPSSPNFRDFNADVANATAPFANDPSHPAQFALYVQDDWRATEKLNLTFGLRADMPIYFTDLDPTPISNSFPLLDENGNPEEIAWDEWPDTQVMWSPRVGFNYDVKGDRTMQVRGGTGIFTGRLPFVWIGNQAANNGPDLGNAFLAASVDDFKWPQVWRTNVAFDQLLPTNTLMTFEILYGDNINDVYVRNPSLANPVGTIPGADGRVRYDPDNNRVNEFGQTHVVDNHGDGYDVSLTAQLRHVFQNGLAASLAYNFTEAKNRMNSTEISAFVWEGNPVEGNPNNFEEGFSQFGHRHRISGSVNYRHAWNPTWATSLGMFFEAAEGGFFTAGRSSRFSYVVGGDLNGDGVSNNDLIYIPRDASEINFSGTAAQQTAKWEAFNAFIEQDDYLSEHRGEISERNGGINPWFTNIDLRILQDLMFASHTFQISFDLENVGNFLNSDWGVREVVNTAATVPLVLTGFNEAGEPVYDFDTGLRSTFIDDPSEISRWRAQIGFRYLFN